MTTSMIDIAQYIEMELQPHQSNFACPVCLTPVEKKYEKTLIHEDGVYCENGCVVAPDEHEDCQKILYIYDATMILRKQYKTLAENPGIASKIPWYHISQRAPQHMEFDTGLEMHVGSLETVAYYRDTIDKWKNLKQDYYVYELAMKDVPVEKELLNDTNYWLPQHQALSDGVDGKPVYAYRYVNRWEAPGSISLIARRDIFEIVNVVKNSLPQETCVAL